MLECAAALNRGGTAIRQLCANVTPRVMDESVWRGEDADALRRTWQGAVMSDVERVLAELESRSRELRSHASEQDQASSPEDGRSLGRPALAGVPEQAISSPGARPPEVRPAMAANTISDDPDGDDGIGNNNGDDSSSPTGQVTEHTLTQEDADRIYEQYQVQDDEMTTWELSGWKRWLAEKVGVDIPDPIQATETEAELLDDLNPLDMKSFNDSKDLAVEETAARYGDENGEDPHPGQAPFNDDHADAFRHAYLNALNSRDIGNDWTTDFWTAHERVPTNDPAREAMDLYNNEVGRRIAEENPRASDQELADLVEQAVADGEMVVIDKDGRLVPSNSITPDQAGHSNPNAEPKPGHPQVRQTS